jgi:DNA-binding MarR family transcriptional regulator
MRHYWVPDIFISEPDYWTPKLRLRLVKTLVDSELDLRDGDWQVLDAFQDPQANLAFQGLKRKLGMHQETLSRALHRLEDDQLVERTDDGYRLTDRGSEVLDVSIRGTAKTSRILETYLPSDISTADVISKLKYSWFSTLRWLGHSENNREAVLVWVTEDGATQVIARFQGNHLLIEIDAADGEKSNVAIKSAYELVARIIREYRVITGHVDDKPGPELARLY